MSEWSVGKKVKYWSSIEKMWCVGEIIKVHPRMFYSVIIDGTIFHKHRTDLWSA